MHGPTCSTSSGSIRARSCKSSNGQCWLTLRASRRRSGWRRTLTMRTAPPMPLTSFVGRDRELVTLAATIEANRLVTVVGPGGVGKTRLALELGRTVDVGREFVFVELAPLLEDDAVAGAVADAVGASGAESSGGQDRDPVSRSVGRLGSRDVLIVLDNCEHVVGAAAAVAAALLHGCPNVRLVATSREPLGVDGERQIMLAPLDVAAASRLFLDRAARRPAAPRRRPGERWAADGAVPAPRRTPAGDRAGRGEDEDPSAPRDLLPSPGSVPAPATHGADGHLPPRGPASGHRLELRALVHRGAADLPPPRCLRRRRHDRVRQRPCAGPTRSRPPPGWSTDRC